jgi:RecA-family ATPase
MWLFFMSVVQCRAVGRADDEAPRIFSSDRFFVASRRTYVPGVPLTDSLSICEKDTDECMQDNENNPGENNPLDGENRDDLYRDARHHRPRLVWNYAAKSWLRRAETSVLFGPSNCGKSALVCHLGHCIVTGSNFFLSGGSRAARVAAARCPPECRLQGRS